jgi:transcriptional regulator with GAF, ATPase, and Fis domain
VEHDRLERLLAALYRTDSAASVLHRLCRVCVDHIGADGASVTRLESEGPRVVECSDDEIGHVAGLQVDLADGPCLEAMATMTAVAQTDLASSEANMAWPRFAPAAHRLGIGAAFAFPLMSGRHASGTLDVYNRAAGTLDPEGAADVTLVADLATLAIARSHLPESIGDAGVSAEPSAAWAHSATVHNACGMLSVQLGVTVDEALLRLRALAFVKNRSVDSLARAVVARELRIDSWEER